MVDTMGSGSRRAVPVLGTVMAVLAGCAAASEGEPTPSTDAFVDAAADSGAPPPDSTLVCAPGTQIACICPGGAYGAQRCASDGSGYGECFGCADSALDSSQRDTQSDDTAPPTDTADTSPPIADSDAVVDTAPDTIVVDTTVSVDTTAAETAAADSGALDTGSADSGPDTTVVDSATDAVGDATDAAPPTVALSLGSSFSCGLRAGTVKCWGENHKGQLGDGTVADKTTPSPVFALSGATAIAAGSIHACAVKGDGKLECWGYNGVGAVGDGTLTDRTSPSPTGLTVTQVAGAQTGTCAVLGSGKVMCWGSNSSGELGIGSTVASLASPAEVSLLTNAVGVGATGGVHVCALRADGFVMCWGSNLSGEIGDGTFVTPRRSPSAVGGLSEVDQIAIGSDHSCALKKDGTVLCWGFNFSGELGDGTTTNRNTPTAVPGLSGVARLFAGHNHTCAIKTDGTLWCWGRNKDGELCDGTTTTRTSPTKIDAYGTVSSIAFGGGHACVVKSDGLFACCGHNATGQLGDGTKTDSKTPVNVKW